MPLASAGKICDDGSAQRRGPPDDSCAKPAIATGLTAFRQRPAMIPAIITFAIIAVLTSAVGLILPIVRDNLGRSRRRRRSKGRKRTHAPRARLDIVGDPESRDQSGMVANTVSPGGRTTHSGRSRSNRAMDGLNEEGSSSDPA